MKEIMSRRGIVGVIAALAAAPKAVEEQAVEVLRDRLFDHGEPPSTLGYGGPPPGQPLSIEQLAMKQLMADAERETRRRTRAIRACHSMSPAAKEAYMRDARQASEPITMKWAKLMGWRAPNDNVRDY